MLETVTMLNLKKNNDLILLLLPIGYLGNNIKYSPDNKLTFSKLI